MTEEPSPQTQPIGRPDPPVPQQPSTLGPPSPPTEPIEAVPPSAPPTPGQLPADLPPPPGYGQPPWYPPPAYPPPLYPMARSAIPRTNGLAVAALVCGILGFIPPLAILAIIFGIIALRQLRPRFQTGKGLAISGLVMAVLWSVVMVPILIAGFRAGMTAAMDERDSGGIVTSGRVGVESLRAGDCFDGVLEGRMRSVTARDCDEPHEAEVATTVELPWGSFPGADEAAALTEELCAAEVEPLVRDDKFEQVELFYLYPDSGFAWRTNRSATCVVMASDTVEKLTGSVLK